ncbi:MAG: hypothetical protein U1A78_19155 [Polyangia bacterium]
MTADEMMRLGEAGLGAVQKRMLRNRPPEAGQVFDDQRHILQRLSWAVAARVPREPFVHAVLGRGAIGQLGRLLLERADPALRPERWLHRHEDLLAGVGAEIAEHVDRALDFPHGCVKRVEVDRRGRWLIHKHALRLPDPEAPVPPRRKPRPFPDEAEVQRHLDAVASAIVPAAFRLRG